MISYPQIIQKQQHEDVLEIVKSIYPSFVADMHELVFVIPEGATITLAQIKDLRQLLQFSGARSRVIVFDSFERATDEAQNALLKILEELGQVHVFYIFTESIDSILPTIRSRCQSVYTQKNHKPETSKELMEVLMTIRENPDGSIFANNRFIVTTMEESRSLLKSIISCLREQIVQGDTWSTEIGKYAMELLQLSKRNNLNPQLSVDAWIVRALLTAGVK